jgi:starch-binding outer membrane protein, SusD/RagB family
MFLKKSKQMKKIFLKSSIYGFLVLSIMACNKMDLAPTNKFTELNYWTSTEKAATVLNTAYMDMAKSEYFFYNEALSDNAYIGRGDVDDAKLISSGQADPSTGRFRDEWGLHYGGIKTCNIFLQYVDQVPGMNDTLKTRMKAESRFIRAFHYFQLVTWFGDVPFFDHDITLDESKTIARTPKADILTFIYKELDDVIAVLPTNKEYSAADNGRITKGAAIALKARVYLYNSQWTDVASACEKLINVKDNGDYSLFPSYEGIFTTDNEYNSEVILDHEYVPGTNRTYSHLLDLAPLSVGARVNSMAATQELVDNYLMLNGKDIKDPASGYDENNPYVNRDPRLTATLVYHLYNWKKPDGTIQVIYIKPGTAPDKDAKADEYVAGSNTTSTGYYLRKYYDVKSEVGFKSGLNLILIRYADVLLMYAEAKNELGQMDKTVWDKTVGAVRQRAGLNQAAVDFPAGLQKDDFRLAIQRERRSELAMEGLRIFDIQRWKTSATVLNGYPHGAKYGDPSVDNGYIRLDKRTFDPARHYLWPVPQAERDLNPNLGQNSGWSGSN